MGLLAPSLKTDAQGRQIWKPNRRQEKFLSIPGTIKEAFYGGAAGGGKSEVLLLLPIVKRWHEMRNFHGIIFRRTFPELKESLIQRSHDFYPRLGGKYNGSDHAWTFPSGAVIRFSYMKQEKDARSHDTAEYNYIAYDELTHFTEFQYVYMLSRLRRSNPGLPLCVRAASNPGNIGHAWVRKRFIEPAPEGDRILVDDEGNKKVFIPALVTDNTNLMEANPDYISQLKQLPEAERKAKLEGDWWTFSGQVFQEFRSIRWPNEPEYAIHVIEPILIPQWWPKLIGIDWGYAAHTWVGWAAISPDRRVYVYRELHVKGQNVARWSATTAALSQHDGNIKTVVLDPSAFQSHGQEKTIADLFQEHSGFIPERADNDRLGGKMVIHDMLRWERRPARFVAHAFDHEIYESIYRMEGPAKADEYLKTTIPDSVGRSYLPRLQIFNTCPGLITALPLCVYDETRKEDIAEFMGDDPVDGSRYLLKAADRYLNESRSTQAKMKRLENILAIQKSDPTDFYRMMRTHEAQDNKSFGTIRSARSRSALARAGVRYH